MMEKLANAILKHSKLIIILWVVLLLVASPFVYKVVADPSSCVKYEMTDMKGADSESYLGMKILNVDAEYFASTKIDYVIVVNYDSPTQKEQIEGDSGFYNKLKAEIEKEYNPEGKKDTGLSITSTCIPETKEGAETGKGMYLVLVTLPKEASRNEGVLFLRDTIKTLEEEGEKTGGYYSDYGPYVTGNAALTYDISKAAMSDVMKIDPFTILLVLILIGLFFRSLISAATPPLTIGVAYAVVLMAVFWVGQITDVFYITTTLVLISMIGAGCDYCIFIIARYREERKIGKSKDDALTEAIKWAGESVAVSGLCVIIGFGVMSLCSFSLVQTMGIILAVGIIFALLAALTLIPSIVHLVGDKIFWPATVDSYQVGSKADKGWYGKVGRLGQKYFRNSARFSIKHAWAILVAAIIITVPMSYVALTQPTSFDMISTMPDSDAKTGITEISNSGNGGMTMPTYILLDMNCQDGAFATITDVPGTELKTLTWNHPEQAVALMKSTWYMPASDIEALKNPDGLGKTILDKSKNEIGTMMGIICWQPFVQSMVDESKGITYDIAEDAAIIALGANLSPDLLKVMAGIKLEISDYETRASVYDYILNVSILNAVSQYKTDTGHQYVKITIMLKDQAMKDTSLKTAVNIREACNEWENGEGNNMLVKDGYRTYTTGTSALLNDIADQVTRDFKIIEVVVILLIIILLMLVMKSYFTPIRSVVTIIMSIMWTLGVTHLLYGDVIGMPIIWLVPIVLFVVCLGLGMDYDVLLTTRIREYVGRGMDNDTAIEQAVEHSGAIITICGLIMGGAFMTLVLSTTPMLQQFGFALGFAILIDALIIRTYVVPAVMHLMGKWNWVGPRFRYREDRQ